MDEKSRSNDNGTGVKDIEKSEANPSSPSKLSDVPLQESKDLAIENENEHEDYASRPLPQESSIDEAETDPARVEDPEALSTVPSRTPPHSVFSKRKKQYIVFLVAWGAFFSPLSANIYFPALTQLAKDYKVTNTVMNLTLTSYMIFQGLAPTIFGDLSDMAGRRPAFAIGYIIYIAANIGLALQNTYAALFVLRCMQASGSSATVALASGVVADIATSAERGTWMGYATSGPMIAPALAPVIGGLLSQFLGWRAIFWFLVIMVAVYLIPFFISFPETARNVVGNGSIPPQGWNMSLLNWLELRKTRKQEADLTPSVSRDEQRAAQAEMSKARKLRFPNPLSALRVVAQKDVGLLLFYNSLVYTAFYDVIASAPYLFEQTYGFNDLQIGLAFIPYGVGALCAPIISGRLMDWNYRRVAKKINFAIDRKRGDDLQKFPLEKVRLSVAVPLLVVGDAALLCYGWAMQVNAPLAAPMVLHFIMGLFLTGAFNCMSVMLVDYYPMSPATATAANNLVRCLMGAAGTGIINIMIDSMGRGWCFTFIAGVVLVTSPILWILFKWGPRWREDRRIRMKEQMERR